MFEEIFAPGNLIYALFLIIALIAFLLNQRWLRYPIMLAALALIGFLQMGCPSPIRALQIIFADLANLGDALPFVAKVGVVLLSALTAGKIFCGWVCPKGTIQEFLFRKPLKIALPPRLDRALRMCKYVALAAILLLPLLFGYQPFSGDTSPFAVIFNLDGGVLAIIFLALILLASLFIYRPYCRYVCPTGALLGLASLLNRVTFQPPVGCAGCQRAEKTCDIGALSISRAAEQPTLAVNKSECLMCGECRQHCPQGLTIRLLRKSPAR